MFADKLMLCHNVRLFLDSQRFHLINGILSQHYIFEVMVLVHLHSTATLLDIELFPHERTLHEFLESGSIFLLYSKHLLQNHTHLRLLQPTALLPKVELYPPQHLIHCHSHRVHIVFEPIGQRFFCEVFWIVVEVSQHRWAIVRTSYKSIGPSSSVAAQPEICNFELKAIAKDDNVGRFDIAVHEFFGL